MFTFDLPVKQVICAKFSTLELVIIVLLRYFGDSKVFLGFTEKQLCLTEFQRLNCKIQLGTEKTGTAGLHYGMRKTHMTCSLVLKI